MSKNKEIIAYQKEQTILKKEVLHIKKTMPVYIIGTVFFMFLIVFAIEGKVYTYFGGTLNFMAFSTFFTLIICVLYFYNSQKKIKEKEKLSKAISSKLYNLMKLEDD
ncbi:hypothetical protein SHK09_12920 [Polaribacter sp. PL03]|uniref:hypothetical protein n=1 Tax=Polaribacter sp. PL03 TaxID=3088353 RepID=UPI0029D1CB4F|nr:hypothetical protein [Polaribacter sp. PL03]MDX6747698.1 hypothetical protein [Polaribacter sp. PL03]